MNRRKFLKVLGIGAGSAGAIAAGIKLPAAAKTATEFKHKTVTGGNVVIENNSSFAKALWPGINKWYNKEYKTYPYNWCTHSWADPRGVFK